MNKLVKELIDLRAELLRMGMKKTALEKLRPFAIPVGEARRFQEAVGSDQPPAKVGQRCELMGFRVIICEDLERLI